MSVGGGKAGGRKEEERREEHERERGRGHTESARRGNSAFPHLVQCHGRVGLLVGVKREREEKRGDEG